MIKIRSQILKSVMSRPYRNLGMIIITFFITFFMIFGNMMIMGIKRGNENIADKMGADIAVVPEGCSDDYEGMLLTAQNNCFYMDDSVSDRIKHMDGIAKISPQTFLMTMEASCCDQSVRIVSINTKDDFTISPWIISRKEEDIKKNEVIVGSDVKVRKDGTFRMYGKKYKVACVLEKSGTIMDSTVYIDKSETEQLKNRAVKKGHGFIKDFGKNDISAVMIKLGEKEDINGIVARLSRIKNISVISSDVLRDSFSGIVSRIKKIFYAISGAIFFLGIIIIFVIQYMVMSERKNEVNIYRILGMKKSEIRNILLKECLLLSSVGATTGVFFSILLIHLFHVFLSKAVHMTVMIPDLKSGIPVFIAGIFISLFTGIICILINFRIIYKNYVYE